MGWLRSMGLAILTLVIASYVLPFHQVLIDLQPNGVNLGTITASEIRLAGFVIASFPLAVLGGITLLSKRFRAWGKPWKWTGSALILGLFLLVWIWEHS